MDVIISDSQSRFFNTILFQFKSVRVPVFIGINSLCYVTIVTEPVNFVRLPLLNYFQMIPCVQITGHVCLSLSHTIKVY